MATAETVLIDRSLTLDNAQLIYGGTTSGADYRIAPWGGGPARTAVV